MSDDRRAQLPPELLALTRHDPLVATAVARYEASPDMTVLGCLMLLAVVQSDENRALQEAFSGLVARNTSSTALAGIAYALRSTLRRYEGDPSTQRGFGRPEIGWAMADDLRILISHIERLVQQPLSGAAPEEVAK